MLVVFFRGLILFTVVFLVIRLMGKRELGQMQPFELVIAIMIADLAIIPMQNPGISLVNGIISIMALLIAHIIISTISIKSKMAQRITSGYPSILINKGKINMKELEKQNVTINELQERLRQSNYPYIEEVYYAILEPSGELSIIEKENKEYDNSKDKRERGLQISLVINKQIDKDNLKRIGKNEKWLSDTLNNLKLKLKDIILLCIDERDKIVFFTEE